MKEKNKVKFYNVLFPVWMIIWIPSLLWLLLIPANYLIDHLVVWLSNRKMPGSGTFCKKHVWKICLAGFAPDFIGSLLLLGAYLSFDAAGTGWAHDVVHGLGFNPFSNLLSFFITVCAVVLAGFCIYVFDLCILQKAGLTEVQARHSALLLAVLTAPYLFLFPSGLLYR